LIADMLEGHVSFMLLFKDSRILIGLSKAEPVYIFLALKFLQNKIIFSDNAKITDGGRFSNNVPAGGDCTRTVEDHCLK